MAFEKTPIATIYKQGKKITIEVNDRDTNIYELYGFLYNYLMGLEIEISFEQEDLKI